MNKKTSMTALIMLSVVAITLWGCAPEIGSEQWCTNLKKKPKGDWSINETADFTKHCIFK